MYDDYQALAAAMMGDDPEAIKSWDEFEEGFSNQYAGCSIIQLEEVATGLLKLMVPQQNSLSKKYYQFFGIESQPGIWDAIIKREYHPMRGDWVLDDEGKVVLRWLACQECGLSGYLALQDGEEPALCGGCVRKLSEESTDTVAGTA